MIFASNRVNRHANLHKFVENITFKLKTNPDLYASFFLNITKKKNS